MEHSVYSLLNIYRFTKLLEKQNNRQITYTFIRGTEPQRKLAGSYRQLGIDKQKIKLFLTILFYSYSKICKPFFCVNKKYELKHDIEKKRFKSK